MRNAKNLSGFDAAVTAFLSSKRSLGRVYGPEEWILGNLRAFLACAAAADLDGPLFDRWRRRSRHLTYSTRIARERVVHKFCRYRRRSERRCFLPDPLSFARHQPYPLPMIVDASQIAQLLAAATSLKPSPGSPIRAEAMRLAIVLLYTTGLRRGELIRLSLDDVDAANGVLRIRESKFHKSRWVPVSPSARLELCTYLQVRRHAGFDQRPSSPLLCGRDTRACSADGFRNRLQALCISAGVYDSAGRAPRVQDFRHSFAVGALLRWYEADADVQVNLPKLALYMGHVSIVSTAYYLRLMPAVIHRASERFARSCASILDGGAA